MPNGEINRYGRNGRNRAGINKPLFRHQRSARRKQIAGECGRNGLLVATHPFAINIVDHHGVAGIADGDALNFNAGKIRHGLTPQHGEFRLQ